MPDVLIRKNFVRYFTLTSELFFSWFENVKKKYFRLSPRNWSYRWRSTFLHAAKLHPSFPKFKGKQKIFPDQRMEKLKMRNLSSSMNGLEKLKVLNWLMSQYRKRLWQSSSSKDITSFRNEPFLEIDSIAVAKISRNFLIFSKHLLCKSMHLWAVFAIR